MNWRIIALAALGIACGAGCQPIVAQPAGPAPDTRPRIAVADIPYVDDAAVLGPWNTAAGYDYLRSGPGGITFVSVTPICGTVGCPNPADRRPAGVIGTTVFYDPEMRAQLTVATWQHELGHIVLNDGGPSDTDCANPYRGVMSYCDFWGARPGWFGKADVARLQRHLGGPVR